MGKTLYLECESGISGDMTVAALLDLGADQQVLKKALASLPVQGFDIRISRVKKSGLDACDFDVVLDKEHENHDHDMEYLHGHTHAHNHATEHMHGHDLHNHDAEYIHEHRSFVDILQIIESSSLTERAKKTATDIFSVLADAEADSAKKQTPVFFLDTGVCFHYFNLRISVFGGFHLTCCQDFPIWIVFESLWRDYFTKSLLIHHLEHVKLQIIGLFCRPQNRVIRCLGAVLDLTQAFVDISCRLMDGLCEQFIGHKV